MGMLHSLVGRVTLDSQNFNDNSPFQIAPDIYYLGKNIILDSPKYTTINSLSCMLKGTFIIEAVEEKECSRRRGTGVDPEGTNYI
jgi:hypothetical protein